MVIAVTLIFFVFGLIIGSFLNVVILRLNTEKSFGGRSACMSCRNKLSWYELIPVVSFIFLRGRCKNCKTKISSQYPIVETITGIIFASLFLKFQDIFFLDTIAFSFTYAYYVAMFSLLLVISVYDFKHKIIPDTLSFVFGILGFLGLFFFNASGLSMQAGCGPQLPPISEFLSGLLIAAPFAFFWFVSKGTWMGLGDAKLALGLGWMLGLSRVFSGAVVAFWIGAVLGLFLVLFKKNYGMKSEIPFAPYLALGAFLAFIFELHLF